MHARRLVQLSDVHLRIGSRDADSARRLQATVAAVLDVAVPPLAVLLSGDLLDVASYERLRELLGVPRDSCALGEVLERHWTFTDAAPGLAFHARVKGGVSSLVETI